MAEEKIINEEVKDEEILIDEELDKVAGGTVAEIIDDANRLRALGFLPYGAASKNDIQQALGKVREVTGLHVGFELNDEKSNHYHINHERISRSKFWNKIYSAIGRHY